MTVRDVIDILSKLDPNLPVYTVVINLQGRAEIREFDDEDGISEVELYKRPCSGLPVLDYVTEENCGWISPRDSFKAVIIT